MEIREFFMTSDSIGFSKWSKEDGELAQKLWGDKRVTKYISANGIFSKEVIQKRWETEMEYDASYGYQYWPLFEKETGDFVGCCGLKPYDLSKQILEMGFQLCPEFWKKGYGFETAQKVMDYAFHTLHVSNLYMLHHPENEASKSLIKKLGFHQIGEAFYEPTGLYHPAYLYFVKEDER